MCRISCPPFNASHSCADISPKNGWGNLSSVPSTDLQSGTAIGVEIVEGRLVIEIPSPASTPEALEIVDLRGRVIHSAVVVPDAGHSVSEPGITAALVEAMDRFKTRQAAA